MFQEASYLPQVWAGSQVNESLLPAVARPLAAHVKLTENCQAKCISCDYWKSRWQDRISTERAVELINEIGAAGLDRCVSLAASRCCERISSRLWTPQILRRSKASFCKPMACF
jgi:hypothetical protein